MSKLSVYASPVSPRPPPRGRWVFPELASGVPLVAASAPSRPFLEARPEGPARRGCRELRRPDGPQQASREPGLRWQSRGVTVGAAVQAFPLALAGVRVECPSF